MKKRNIFFVILLTLICIITAVICYKLNESKIILVSKYYSYHYSISSSSDKIIETVYSPKGYGLVKSITTYEIVDSKISSATRTLYSESIATAKESIKDINDRKKYSRDKNIITVNLTSEFKGKSSKEIVDLININNSSYIKIK